MLQIEDVLHHQREFVDLRHGISRQTDRLLQLPLQQLTLRGIVLGHNHAGRVLWHHEDVGHAGQRRLGLRVIHVVQIKPQLQTFDGIIDHCLNPVGRFHLANDIGREATQVEALLTVLHIKPNRTSQLRGLNLPRVDFLCGRGHPSGTAGSRGRRLCRDRTADQEWPTVFSDEWVLRIHRTSLREQCIGGLLVACLPGFARLPHQVAEPMLPRDRDRDGVVAVHRVELEGARKVALGTIHVTMLKLLGAGEVGVFGFAQLTLSGRRFNRMHGYTRRGRLGPGGGIGL